MIRDALLSHEGRAIKAVRRLLNGSAVSFDTIETEKRRTYGREFLCVTVVNAERGTVRGLSRLQNELGICVSFQTR